MVENSCDAVTNGLVQSRAIGFNQEIGSSAAADPIALPEELFAVDADLKRTAKGVIDRILHLRDSL